MEFDYSNCSQMEIGNIIRNRFHIATDSYCIVEKVELKLLIDTPKEKMWRKLYHIRTPDNRYFEVLADEYKQVKGNIAKLLYF